MRTPCPPTGHSFLRSHDPAPTPTPPPPPAIHRYVALVKGHLAPGSSGTISIALEGRPAIACWLSLSCMPSVSFGHLSTVHLWPQTGRTHQLRKVGQGVSFWACRREQGIFLLSSLTYFMSPSTACCYCLPLPILLFGCGVCVCVHWHHMQFISHEPPLLPPPHPVGTPAGGGWPGRRGPHVHGRSHTPR